MSCVEYNLVKEGNLVNTQTTVSGILLLTNVQISALYDGDSATPAVTISGSPQFISLQQQFGEGFDVCYLRYHTNSPSLSGIYIDYVTNNGTVTVLAPFLESAGVYRADIDDEVLFLNLKHTVSGTAAEVYELEIIPTRNEKLGFGTISEPQDFYRSQHATTDIVSASANVIKVFNDSAYDDVAKISVLPTLSEVDNYIRIGTSSSGTFYGINEYGFTHPGPNPIKLYDDALTSYLVDPQWERRGPAQNHTITPTPEGLIFNTEFVSTPAGSDSRSTTGLYSTEVFTATSFTAEFQIRFLYKQAPAGLYDEAAKDFFFALTNSFPIPDIGYKDTWATDRRRGGSIVGIAMKPVYPTLETFRYEFRWVDGNGTNDPRDGSLESRWTGGEGSGNLLADQYGEVGNTVGPLLTDFEDITKAGAAANDFTSSADWHTWRLSYDHRTKKVSGFVDGIYLGHRLLRIEAFGEACRLFIGMNGYGGTNWAIRNFKIHKDVIYRQKNVASSLRGGVASATVSGSFAFNINDESTSTRYVAPSPNSNTVVRVDFDKPYDVCYYKLKQRDQSSSVSAYGQTYFPDVARQAIVDFGGVRTDVHLYPNTSSFVSRSPTHSGIGYTTASGVEYISFRFTDYDRTTDGLGALIIDELEVYADEYLSVEATPEPNVFEVPWVSGRWSNLKQYGNTNCLALRAKDYVLPSYLPMPEYLLENVDWGASTSLAGRQFVDNPNEYHFGGSLFSSRGTTEAGFYRQWHSATQSDHNIFLWRYFSELSEVCSVYWDSNAYHGAAPAIADKFKFQYLSEDGNPNIDTDWIDIPPIKKQHPYTGGSNNADSIYKEYKNYLITNNDGEFYTNYFLVSGTLNSTGFSIASAASLMGVPKGLAIPAGYVSSSRVVVLTGSNSSSYPSNNGDQGYVEFDTPIKTRAIKMVIHTARIGSTSTAPVVGLERFEFAFDDLLIFRTHGAGSYTSPVFDTGTKQNTERLVASVRKFGDTSHTVYVRSSEEPPEYSYDPVYEVWESRGFPGSSSVPYNIQSIDKADRVIVYKGLMYFIREASPKIYDPVLDLWSDMTGYPTAGGDSENSFGSPEDGNDSASSGAKPDIDVINHSVLFGDILYVACVTTGDNVRPRLMKIDLSAADPKWLMFGENRPVFAEDAVMAGDEVRNRLYFFAENGEVSYYDIVEENWVSVEAVMPTYAGSRSGIATAVVGRNVYLLGGTVGNDGRLDCDVFNFDSETFSKITSAPFRIVFSQAVYVPEEDVIYTFPVRASRASSYNATMKYHVSKGTWEVCESLMWFDDAGQKQTHLADFYYYDAGFVYRMAFLFGGSRAYVLRKPWTASTIPDFRDPKWGGPVGQVIPWIKSDLVGELMPQERYIQFKVELYSHDLYRTPVLEDITVVLPQDIPVPASGTANAYFKVGAIPYLNYQGWYSAGSLEPSAILSNAYSVMYTESENGSAWNMATVASGTWYKTGESQNDRHTVYGPWVLKDGGQYKKWFVKDHTATSTHDPEIYYSSHANPDYFSGEVLSVPKGAISQSSKGTLYPCVVKLSPTSYKMWYTGLDSSEVQRIIMASSTDGISWTSHTLSLNIGQVSQDAISVSRPCVLLEGSLYRMWYTGRGSDGLDRILYTESSNGLSWIPPVVILNPFSEGEADSKGCRNAIIFSDGPEYVMYYIGYDGAANYIVRATSPDSVEWFNFTVAIPPGGIVEYSDADGLKDIFVISNRQGVVPGTVFTDAKLKIYNAGAAV